MDSWAGRIRSIKRTAALAVFGAAVGFLLPAGSPVERIYPPDAVRALQPDTMSGGHPGGRLSQPPATLRAANVHTTSVTER